MALRLSIEVAMPSPTRRVVSRILNLNPVSWYPAVTILVTTFSLVSAGPSYHRCRVLARWDFLHRACIGALDRLFSVIVAPVTTGFRRRLLSRSLVIALVAVLIACPAGPTTPD